MLGRGVFFFYFFVCFFGCIHFFRTILFCQLCSGFFFFFLIYRDGVGKGLASVSVWVSSVRFWKSKAWLVQAKKKQKVRRASAGPFFFLRTF